MNRAEIPSRDKQDRSLKRRGMLRLAALTLIWERFWPALWPLIAVVLVFTATALFDVLPKLPHLLHWLVLAAFAAAALFGLRKLFRVNMHVEQGQCRERLERDSRLAHRPLNTLEDRPVSEGAGGLSDRIWRAHRRRVMDGLGKLSLNAPSPGMSRLDPYAFRMAAVLLCVLALGIGWSDAGARFERALSPTPRLGGAAVLKLDVWVTPPDYTGLAPVYLEYETPGADAGPGDAGEEDAKVLEIPVGSAVLAQVNGIDSVPEITLGKRISRLASIAGETENGGYRGETVVVNEDRDADLLSVVGDGQPIASWPVRIAEDRPPVAEFVDPPKKVGKSGLALHFEARDDFALRGVWALIRPSGQIDEDREIRIELPATGLGTPLGKGRSRHDYSAHPWAGTPVELRLIAEDAKGQIGESDPFAMILPERIFNHPVARALIEERRKLNMPSEEKITSAVNGLARIGSFPARFFHDTVVFLNIAVARSRLMYQNGKDSIASVQKLLWETALRIEDGEFAIADRDLREAQDRLAKAMREGAADAELDKLMAELQEALDKYLSALAEHLQRQGVAELPMNPSMRAMETGDLQRMLQQTRDLAKTGAMDAAREMLARLNQMLDSLRDGVQMAPRNGRMAQVRKMMDELRNLTKRQRELLDKTFRELQNRQGQGRPMPRMGQRNRELGRQGRQGQQGEQGQRQGQPRQGQGPLQGMARQQRGLRTELGRLMLQMDQMLGSIPGAMGKAERSMKGAGQSLGRGDAGGAVPQQTEALEQLRNAANQAAEQLARRMQGQMGLAPGMSGQRPNPNRDPFGRRTGGANGRVSDDGQIKVPSERDVIRAREILDELHRRAGERNRPQIEREFIDRLLRRF